MGSTFRLKKKETERGWGKLHNEELHNFFLPIIFYWGHVVA
jgi:hypothetical protein